MSELLSAIDALAAEDLSPLPDARAEDDFALVRRARERLEVEFLRRLADIERRGIHARDGHVSTVSWLADTGKVGWGTARKELTTARALEEMPLTRRAVEAGDLSLSAAELLVRTREADPEAFREAEGMLVEAAEVHSMGDLQRVAGYWRQAAERAQGEDPDDQLRARRRLHASVTFLGMVRVDGDLDPETGETLLTALRAVMDAEARSGEGDDRTPPQRRADALGEICRQWLELADRPRVAGERPHVTVTVPLDALPAGEGGGGEFDHVGVTGAGVARRLACDASLTRVVMAGQSQPLDVGRRTRRLSVDAPGSRRAGPPLPVPRVRPPPYLMRRPPRGALGGRGSDGAPQPDPALPAAPPHGPRAGQVPAGAGG